MKLKVIRSIILFIACILAVLLAFYDFGLSLAILFIGAVTIEVCLFLKGHDDYLAAPDIGGDCKIPKYYKGGIIDEDFAQGKVVRFGEPE